jgi:NADH:ubiquinone oxidoreductase subunit E
MKSETKPTLEDILQSCRPNSPRCPNILRTLLSIQEALGHVPPHAVPQIAQALNVTDAQVAGVLSYYPDLRTQVPGRCTIRVCTGESCTANHGGRVLRVLREHLHVDIGGTTPGGRFTLEKVSCVGNCAVSPTIIIGDVLYGRVVPSQIPSLLDLEPS